MNSRRVLVVELGSMASTSRFPGRALVGGKGLSLAWLRASGFAIPETAVLTTRLFRAHAKGLEPIARVLARGERPGAAALSRARSALARPLPPALAAAVTPVLERLLARSRSGAIALRSSATGEDREAATFAGLHDSILGVDSLDGAFAALHACWASLLSDRALEYRARRRIRSALEMAVVVQEHVTAVAAGVAFSAVGWGERRRLVVELAPPGESAPVTGSETPLRFEVPRVPAGGASPGDVALAAAPLASVLTHEQAIDVVRLALRAEEMLGGPSDIEWLLEPAGTLVLVQARPARAASAPRFDRTAVAESLPDAVKPLGRDLLLRAYGRAFAEHRHAPLSLASRVLVYKAGRFFLDNLALARISGRRRGEDDRDERRRARMPKALRDGERALRAIRREVPRARSLAGLWRRTERELERLLPLYLLAQDDVTLIQETILRARARLGLPIGAPPPLEAGRELADALARGDAKELAGRFGHRGGVELDIASPPLEETVREVRRGASPLDSPRVARSERKDHPAIEGLLEHGRGAAERAERLRDAVTLAIRTARRIALRAGLGEDVFFLGLGELEAVLRGSKVKPRLAARRRAFERDAARRPPLAADDPERVEETVAGAAGDELRGVAASSGTARGPARVVRSKDDVALLAAGEILVAHAATAELFGTLLGAAGLVTDVGGMLSHGAILARELGIPAVVATERASELIATGDFVAVDGERGVVRIVKAPEI